MKKDKLILLDKFIITGIIICIGIIPLVYLPYSTDLQLIPQGIDNYILLQYDNIYRPKVITFQYITIFILIFALIRIKYEKKIFISNKSFKPLIYFLVLLTLSTVFSPYLWRAIYGNLYRWEGFLTYLAYIILFFSCSIFVDKWGKVKLILNSLMVSAIIISLYGLIQYIGFDFIKRDPIRENWARIFSTLGNPNFAGSYIIMLLVIALVLYFQSNTKTNLYKYGLLSTIYYSFMVATLTRSAWLAFAFIIPIIIYYCQRKIKENPARLIYIVIIFLLITFFLNLIDQGSLEKRFYSIYIDTERLLSVNDLEKGKAGSNRIFIYLTSIPLLWERPLLGSGLDTFDKVYPQEIYQQYLGSKVIIDKAHNVYLQLGVTVGIPALIFYLCFLYSIFKQGLRKARRKNKYQIALFIAFIAYCFQALFNISVVSVAPVFWAIMGLNIAVVRLVE